MPRVQGEAITDGRREFYIETDQGTDAVVLIPTTKRTPGQNRLWEIRFVAAEVATGLLGVICEKDGEFYLVSLLKQASEEQPFLGDSYEAAVRRFSELWQQQRFGKQKPTTEPSKMAPVIFMLRRLFGRLFGNQ